MKFVLTPWNLDSLKNRPIGRKSISVQRKVFESINFQFFFDFCTELGLGKINDLCNNRNTLYLILNHNFIFTIFSLITHIWNFSFTFFSLSCISAIKIVSTFIKCHVSGETNLIKRQHESISQDVENCRNKKKWKISFLWQVKKPNTVKKTTFLYILIINWGWPDDQQMLEGMKISKYYLDKVYLKKK